MLLNWTLLDLLATEPPVASSRDVCLETSLPSICSLLKGNFIYLCIGRHPVQQVAAYATTYVAYARSAARICIIELLSSKLMIIETGETSRPHNSWKDIIFMEIRIYTQPAAFYCHLSAINDSNDRLFTIYASNYFYILISKFCLRTDLTIITDT